MSLPSTIDAFLELVVNSGVLEKETLDPYIQQMQAAGTLPDAPGDLGAALVRDGLLTRFQVNQFLQGKWRGFWISGKYKLLDHLGAGGMGAVFLCEHKSMRRRVAIKVLPPDAARDPSSLDRFYREARAVAALDHPNIVRAHDIDHDGKHHFLVLEYVEGASLEDVVKRRGPMNVTRAAHYIRQAALGLHHAHQAGLVHRDVKPGNILVDRQGVVKILDMGLARFFHDTDDNLTREHDETSLLGTADYLAPEQAINSHSVDIRADVYSLGATFYFLLAGRPPFGEGTVAQKLVCHQMRNPRPIREVRPETPEGLAAVVAKMMEKDTRTRYQTPAEVYEALAPWTQTPVPPPSEEEIPPSSGRGRRGASGEGSASKLSNATLTSAPWLVSTAPPVFPSAESTTIQTRLVSDEPAPSAVLLVEKTEAPSGARRRPLLWAAVFLPLLLAGGLAGGWAYFHFTAASESGLTPTAAPPAPPDAPDHGPAPVADSKPPIGPVQTPDKPPAPPAPAPQSFVCTMSVDDLTEHVVLASPDRWDCAVWTPDGKSLLSNSGGKLHRLPLAGGPPEDFSTGSATPTRDYALSPDGKRLAFTAHDAVYLAPGAGGTPAPILPKKFGYVFCWSPDGKTILYAAARNGPAAVFSRPADGGEETRLLAYPGLSDTPAFSPDGQWIYFSCDKSGKVRLWRVPASGGGPNDEGAEQVTDDGFQDWFPHPSPDGKWLLFLSDPANSSGIPHKADVVLRLAPLPGDRPQAGPIREVVRLHGGQGTINAPCWSPDGKTFAYVRYAPLPK